MIEAVNLTKIFRDKKRGEIFATKDVSFRVVPGEIYGLLGANGAGKTSTLRVLATLLAPSSGSAVIAGHDIVRAPEKVRAHVGFLAASTALYGRLTARDLHLPVPLYDETAYYQAVKDRWVGLGDYATEQPAR